MQNSNQSAIGTPPDSVGRHTLERIAEKLDSMPRVSREIAEYVLQNPESVIRSSISELARRAGIKSESSVVRFYQAIGFGGYHEFKVALASDIAGNTFYHALEDIDSNDTVGTVKRKLFEASILALQQNLKAIDNVALDRAVELIAGAHRLIFLGYGPSAAVGYDAYFKFTRLGLHCHWSTDPHVNAVLLSEVSEGDVVFVVSHAGEERDHIMPLRRARPPAKVVSITGNADCPLSRVSDVCIVTASEEKNYRTDALVSRIVQKVLVSALYAGVAIRRGDSIMERLYASRQALSYLMF